MYTPWAVHTHIIKCFENEEGQKGRCTFTLTLRRCTFTFNLFLSVMCALIGKCNEATLTERDSCGVNVISLNVTEDTADQELD